MDCRVTNGNDLDWVPTAKSCPSRGMSTIWFGQFESREYLGIPRK